jgi:acyl carrier protein
MTEAEIRDNVYAVLRRIAPEADPQVLQPTQDLRQALDIDSFDYLQLMIGLHERLGVEIPEADYPQLSTIAGMIQYLSGKRTSQ